MIGSAAFLLPDGRIEPESGREPSTTYCMARYERGESEGDFRGEGCSPAREEVKQ
jgi:hypothetical protein